MKKINALALSSLTAFALIGCGGGGSGGVILLVQILEQ